MSPVRLPVWLSALAAVAVFLLFAASASAASIVTGPTGHPMQVTEPAGTYDLPRGVALIIHGGGWQENGPQTLATQQPNVDLVVRAGWIAVNVDYRRGSGSLEDVLGVYAWARNKYGKRIPTCAVGESAGGHLALMLAVRRSSLDCVVGMGAPTHLAALEHEGPFVFREGVEKSFRPTEYDAYSPALQAKKIKAKVLLGTVSTDQFVPVAQQARFLKAHRQATGMVLAPGDAHFVHANADPDYLSYFQQKATKLLESVEKTAKRSKRR